MRLAQPSTIARALPALVIAATAGCLEAPPDDLADGERPQLLVNPGFEDGALGWVVIHDVRVGPSEEIGSDPASGDQAANISGASVGSSALIQIVDLPHDATGVVLRGFHCVITFDVSSEPSHFCDVHGEIDGERTFFRRTSNLDRSNPGPCSWQPFSIAGSATPGATLHLMLMAIGGANQCLYDGLELIATYR